jgi:hypothetical protein
MVKNRQKFISVRNLFLATGIIVFLVYFLTHLQLDLLSAFVTAALLASFLFAIGIMIAAYALLPSKMFKKMHSNGFSSSEITPDEASFYCRNDWYNDVTNPASPVYKATYNPIPKD